MATKIATWNANAIRNRRMELIDFLREEEIDIMTLTETHLKPSQSFSLPDHSIVRLDRLAARNGGIAIAIRRTINFRTLSLPGTKLIEAAGIEVSTSRGCFRLFAVYCPRQARERDGTDRILRNDLRALTRSPGDFVIAGDLNAKHRQWGNERANKNGAILMEDMQAGFYAVSFPSHPTFVNSRSQSTLDIFLSNMFDRIDVPVTITALSSDHLPVVTYIQEEATQTWRQRHNYREADWSSFERIMEETIEINAPLHSEADIDTALESIETNFRTAETRSVPLVQTRTRLVSIDLETKLLIGRKNAVRRLFQRTGDRAHYTAFRSLDKVIKIRLAEARNRQFSEEIGRLHKCSTPFWRITKVLKTRPRPIPPLRDSNLIFFTPEEKAQKLADQFYQSHTLSESMVSPHEDVVRNSIQGLTQAAIILPDAGLTTFDEVQRLVKYSVGFKAPGADRIFNIMLKHAGNATLAKIVEIFNRCLELGYFPRNWKFSKVVPIRKPGKDPPLPTSYRPISLLPALSKIFERVIYTRMVEHCDNFNILTNVQFGFRKGHSTAHQLQRVLNAIKNGHRIGMSSAMALLDVEKAFDNVWHNALIHKLCSQDFPTYLVKIIQSYLSSRTSAVFIGQSRSESYENCAGVPQGSVLGPLLYNCYTTDIPALPRLTQLSLYADDTAIVYSNKVLGNLARGLQNGLDRYVNYLNSWKIRVNSAKTQAMVVPYRQGMRMATIGGRTGTIRLQSSIIPWAESVRYLGVTIDKKLSFRQHIEHLSTKTLGLLLSLYPLINRRSRLSVDNKLIVYRQIVLPALMYGSNAWGTCSARNKLVVQRIQNKFLKLIHNLPNRYPTSDLHELDGIPLIEERIRSDLERLRCTSLASTSPLIQELFVQ